MRFTLDEATPSNNVIMRMHHRERTKQHQRIAWAILAAVGSRRPMYERCRVIVTRYAPRQLDFDNMGGGLKFLMDGMVKAGLIVDDSPKCVESLELKQVKCAGKNARTEVEIIV